MDERRETEEKDFYFYFFFSLASLFDIRKSDHWNSSGQEKKCSTRRGLCLGTKNTGFRRVFNLKIRKILCFGFSQIYGFLTVRIGRRRRQN